jgi:hypothetical protein
MISTKLPCCRLKSMSYQNGNLSIQFAKYNRTYANVPQQTAYKLFYSTTGRLVLEIYANEIKGKFEVIQVS